MKEKQNFSYGYFQNVMFHYSESWACVFEHISLYAYSIRQQYWF